MPSTSRRNLLRAAALPAAATLGFSAAPRSMAESAARTQAPAYDVTSYGARGDGQTPSAAAFQAAMDAAEQAGGGWVTVPPGMFILERTPLIGSRVHLRGTGAATVLRGSRSNGHRGSALISNKGQQAAGYEGAHDWSITNVAIDSPDSNGIVVTHALRVYLADIHGVDSYHHFIDLAGRDILCERLFLTGRSGTSSFQIDSLHGAQRTWDGERAVSPNLDGTEARNVILRNSVITATAGAQGDRPRHDVSVHFHGSASGGMVFSDLILGGATTGFYQDAGTRYDNVQIDNVCCENPGHAVLFNPGRDDQRNLMIRGLIHDPEPNAAPYRGLAIHGRRKLLIDGVQLDGEGREQTDYAALISGSRQVSVRGMQASGQGGTGLMFRDQVDDAPTRMGSALVQGCQLDGFEVGCAYERSQGGDAIHVQGNLIVGARTRYRGPTQTLE